MDAVDRFYHSGAWRKFRPTVIAERGGLCEECLKRGIVNANGYHCHHIIELTEDNVNDASIALNADNIMILCKSCHDDKHPRANKRRFTVSDDGKIVSNGK